MPRKLLGLQAKYNAWDTPSLAPRSAWYFSARIPYNINGRWRKGCPRWAFGHLHLVWTPYLDRPPQETAYRSDFPLLRFPSSSPSVLPLCLERSPSTCVCRHGLVFRNLNTQKNYFSDENHLYEHRQNTRRFRTHQQLPFYLTPTVISSGAPKSFRSAVVDIFNHRPSDPTGNFPSFFLPRSPAHLKGFLRRLVAPRHAGLFGHGMFQSTLSRRIPASQFCAWEITNTTRFLGSPLASLPGGELEQGILPPTKY
jgi:hypothetical protein